MGRAVSAAVPTIICSDRTGDSKSSQRFHRGVVRFATKEYGSEAMNLNSI